MLVNGNHHLAGDDRRLGRDWDFRPEFRGLISSTPSFAGRQYIYNEVGGNSRGQLF